MKTLSPTQASADTGSADDIDRLMAKAFFVGRDPRSAQYRQGVRSILEHRLAGTPLNEVPYRMGTAEADAYFVGQSEGHAIARREKSDAA